MNGYYRSGERLPKKGQKEKLRVHELGTGRIPFLNFAA